MSIRTITFGYFLNLYDHHLTTWLTYGNWKGVLSIGNFKIVTYLMSVAFTISGNWGNWGNLFMEVGFEFVEFLNILKATVGVAGIWIAICVGVIATIFIFGFFGWKRMCN